MKYILILLASLCINLCGGTIQLENSVVVADPAANAVERFAAIELAKHLSLIAGSDIPVVSEVKNGQYPFFIGKIPSGKSRPTVRDAAIVEITPQATYIYGEDNPVGDLKNMVNFLKFSRSGTLFAVYELLEQKFGVRWIEPGDDGIVFAPAKTFSTDPAVLSWDPGAFILRQIRPGYGENYNYYKKSIAPKIPAAFRMKAKEHARKINDVTLFLKRHRMGRSANLSYGHAFTSWWQEFGKEHPEYFAMQPDGVRRPEDLKQPDRVKMCVTNPALLDKIVRDWQTQKPLPDSINACENDSGGFCRCPECMKLDTRTDKEDFLDHLTDRYIWFGNEILRRATAKKPDVMVVMYAYSYYRFPPRREKVDPRMVLGFVPSMLEMDEVAGMYEAWAKAGAKKIFLRPNDQHVNTGLPMGFEKQLFDHFKLGVKHGIVGTDYDMLHNFWPATGIADYILARAHTEPEKSFEELEEEYCSAFGAASEDVKAYFRYFRNNIWEKRVMPHKKEILTRGRYGNFRRGLMWDINRYYRLDDFDQTDRILEHAAAQKLSEIEARRVESLRLANQHARLSFVALTAENKFKPGKELLRFRQENRDKLNIDWGALFEIEEKFGDVTGVFAVTDFADFDDVRSLPLKWRIKLDPKLQGEIEKWEKTSPGRQEALWHTVSVDRSWEQQNDSSYSPEFKEQLKQYDGIAYYGLPIQIDPAWQGKRIQLRFGGVDESCQVYCNGKLAGARPFQNPDDWKTPFFIDITDTIDWGKKEQNLVVRVEDTAGAGGIWKPVYLVAGTNGEEK